MEKIQYQIIVSFLKVKLKILIEKQIEQFKSNQTTFVFFIVNPITAIISRLIIEYFKLEKNKILIVSFRNTPIDFLNYPHLTISLNRVKSILQNLFFFSSGGIKILKKINNNFVLFTSWAFRESNWLINSNKCQGHFYIEEGQGSYMLYRPFNYSKTSFLTFIMNNFKNRINNGEKTSYFYRDDSLGFIGVLPICFPIIEKNKKLILKNISLLKKIYKPKTIGIKNIALGCAERRLLNKNWYPMIEKIIRILPEGGIIKLHPSFYIYDEKIKKIKSYLANKTNNRIQLCDADVILEAEMLFEKKTFYGPQTSLLFYAKHFGSNFVSINLY